MARKRLKEKSKEQLLNEQMALEKELLKSYKALVRESKKDFRIKNLNAFNLMSEIFEYSQSKGYHSTLSKAKKQSKRQIKENISKLRQIKQMKEHSLAGAKKTIKKREETFIKNFAKTEEEKKKYRQYARSEKLRDFMQSDLYEKITKLLPSDEVQEMYMKYEDEALKKFEEMVKLNEETNARFSAEDIWNSFGNK